MIWIWLGVVVSLLLIEYMSKNFTAICFAISGMVACVMTKFQEKYNMQLLVFLVLGIFLILVLRPVFLKWLEKKREKVEVSPKVTIVCFFILGVITTIFAPMKNLYRICFSIALGLFLLLGLIICYWKKKRHPKKELEKHPEEEKKIVSKRESTSHSKTKKKKKK